MKIETLQKKIIGFIDEEDCDGELFVDREKYIGKGIEDSLVTKVKKIFKKYKKEEVT